MTDQTYRVAKEELESFVKRRERIDADIKDHQDARKELHAELKSRGLNLKAFNVIVAMRKKSRDELAEEGAVVDMYAEALGM